MRRALPAALVLAAALAACGGSQADDDGSVVDAATDVDGSTSDAPGGCTVVVDFQPAMPMAGSTVQAYGMVFGAPGGILEYRWTVTKGGTDVPYTRIEGDNQGITFPANEAGIYNVSLDVGVGCQPFFGGLNVSALGANNRALRLRFVPPAGVEAPPQERTIVVAGGADYAAGVLTLDRGIAFPVTVRTPQAAPVAAYLRFISRATPDAVVESFSDAGGNAAVRLISGNYDVLVVPASAALAPILITNWDPHGGVLTVDGGEVLTGTVLDAGGAPVAGAGVSVMSGGVPSTIGTTAGDGSFSLRWRDHPGADALTVVPPPGSDLPRLDATADVGDPAALTVRYAAVPTSDVEGTLVSVGGSAAPATDVLVAVSRPASGTVRDGAIVLATAVGSQRRTLTTDAGGRLPAARLLDGDGAAFIAAAGPGAYAALTLPLTGDLAAGAPVTVTGTVARSGGGGVPWARLRATLTGPLAQPGTPVPSVIADVEGDFALALAAGAPYRLHLWDPSGEDAALTVDVAAAQDQVLSSLVLPGAIAITGEVRTTGTASGAPAVGIAALCHLDCDGVARARPLGEAVTDGTGRFVLTVPDPGVTPP